MVSITPVILCGGSGTRLWPLSRSGFPKQFLCLTGQDSLFQQAVKRLAALTDCGLAVSAPVIVGNEEHRFLAQEQLREAGIDADALLLEPLGRNTAPALTLAALHATSHELDPVLVVTPSDHIIADPQAFSVAVQQAIHEAGTGAIVMLGITPDRPETGYGYIKAPVTRFDARACKVEAFIEKPDLATARLCLDQGGYYWNAGMFVVRASVWLSALQSFRHDILDATRQAWVQRCCDARFIRPDKTAFARIPAESIDYAVMEHCPGSPFSLQMVPLDAGWSDLGAWDAVWNAQSKDEAGNSHMGDVLSVNCHNTLVHASSRLVSLVGVQELVVVETADAVLVADKSSSQNVREIVTQLTQQKRDEPLLHRKVHRPWGWYNSIDDGARFKVKRIQVKPNASLSLQKHFHRAEHWIVVKGTAEITNGDKTILLTENQSTYIPLGEVHRLFNPGTIPLEIIEVQTGSYLGEDDIVRFDDSYGR
ncbi:mannose-1-phosphate guanylyltransferase/mannose-6-phosphate isomerase [Laribacter hongkongensis]|uniref:mannose-1-phosphate guanylyltransferase/mannose-6-phosphate isomerase n=1 Tax=Laribacter hongkongensis TaxID=168471 RepID=UPI0023D949BE|nr:mannose-1-phosphate guanylyltransferase/mannose-6-phosphate isomerase [Laribacter hongkongensis]MCG9083975.1 mannose-1-phosphate guanylyltransferase/mannose-6-phosphate isomerase [Laribacter hongkongensis]